MSFIRTTEPHESEGAVAAMYRRQQASWGYVPNYAKVFCHRPEIMARWAQLLAEIKRPMDLRRFELATFAAAHELRNTACALAHGRRLRDFVSDDDLLAVAAGRPAADLSEAEQALTRFARLVARDASRVTRDHVDELRAAGFTDAEVFDIAAAAAGRAFFTKLLDALGVLADAPLSGVPAALRAALVVGRPVDEAPCATMPLAGLTDEA